MRSVIMYAFKAVWLRWAAQRENLVCIRGMSSDGTILSGLMTRVNKLPRHKQLTRLDGVSRAFLFHPLLSIPTIALLKSYAISLFSLGTA